MELPAWFGVVKSTVTVVFFCLFAGILAWTFTSRGLEDNRFLPLQDEVKPDV